MGNGIKYQAQAHDPVAIFREILNRNVANLKELDKAIEDLDKTIKNLDNINADIQGLQLRIQIFRFRKSLMEIKNKINAKEKNIEDIQEEYSKACSSILSLPNLEKDSKFYNDVPITNANKKIAEVLEYARVFVQRLDYASINQLRKRYEKQLQDSYSIKNDLDQALLDYLRQSNKELFGNLQKIDLLGLEIEIQAANDMVAGLNDWLSYSKRTANDILNLKTMVEKGGKEAEDWLSANGLSPKMLTNPFFKSILLRQYGVSSVQELYSDITKYSNDNLKNRLQPPDGSLASLFGLMHGCFQLLEESRLISIYRSDSKYFNAKFETLDIFGKYAFLTNTLGWIATNSLDAKEVINIVLTDANLLTPAGQIGYLNAAIPKILRFYSETDQILGVSNALRGTALLYGQVYDFPANGQRQYFSEVDSRIGKALMDYLEILRSEIFTGGVGSESPLKTLDQGARATADFNRAGVYPSNLNFMPFQNLALQAYMDATSNTHSRGLGDLSSYGNPTSTIDEFFKRGLPEIVPIAPPPRKEEWYGPPLDSLLREITRVDLTRHHAHVFSTFEGNVFASGSDYNTKKEGIVEVDAKLFGPLGSINGFYTRNTEEQATHLRLIGQDLSNGKNWTIQNINANWNKEGVSEELNGALNAYFGKETNTALFFQNEKDEQGNRRILVRSYIKIGQNWFRFFSESLSPEQAKRQYGRIFYDNTDVETAFENNQLSGAVVGINLEKIGIKSAAVAGATTPHGVFGLGLNNVPNDVGLGTYLLLGKSGNPNFQPVIFARYTKVSDRNIGGVSYVTKPFFAQLSLGDAHFDIGLGYRNEQVYVKAKYLDAVTMAYSTNYYSMKKVERFDPEKFKAIKQQRIRGGSLEAQYDWGGRNSLYAIGNTLSHAPFIQGSQGNAISSQSALIGFRIKGKDNPFGDKFIAQASYSYDPISYGRFALDYLHNLYVDYGLNSPLETIGDARGTYQQAKLEFERIARSFDPITSSIIDNTVRTLKFKSEQEKWLLELVSTNRGSLINIGGKIGKVTFGGTLAKSDVGRILALQLSGEDIIGIDFLKTTVAFPLDDKAEGFNLNAGVEKGNWRFFGSYTNWWDRLAQNIATSVNNALHTPPTTLQKPSIEQLKQSISSQNINRRISSFGFGAEYRPDQRSKYFIIFTHNKNGVTNARITDNIDETINTTLTGATAGVTVYSFNENGIRESWTFGAFGEKITIRELTKQTEKFFSTNQYGVLLKSQQPWGEAGVKVGVEFYKIPIDTGKGGFINVTFRFLF